MLKIAKPAKPLTTGEIIREALNIRKQLQSAPEPNDSDGRRYIAYPSPEYLERATFHDNVLLLQLLPYQTLRLSAPFLRRSGEMYLSISQDEDRSKRLRLEHLPHWGGK